MIDTFLNYEIIFARMKNAECKMKIEGRSRNGESFKFTVFSFQIKKEINAEQCSALQSNGKNGFLKIKIGETNPISFRFSIYELRASWSLAQACSFGVPKTKRGHNKTCNFAKRSQIPRRLVFHSSCYGAGCCERFLAIYPNGNFEKRSQFIHLRFPIADLRFANRQRKRIYGVSSAEFEAKPNLIRLNPTESE